MCVKSFAGVYRVCAKNYGSRVLLSELLKFLESPEIADRTPDVGGADGDGRTEEERGAGRTGVALS